MSAHRARKRFGQNFLVDRAILTECVAAIDPQPGQRIIEIGPGLGALTEGLLARVEHIDAVEIDRDIVIHLQKKFNAAQLTLHSADALEYDFSRVGDHLRVVGNLPYNISTPLLFHLKRFSASICDMHFMLQKEVVERMVAQPGGRDYGRLSVMLQCDFAIDSLFGVPASAFEPAPKVESAFVKLVPLAQPLVAAEYSDRFASVVAAAFNQRRKTLRNALQGIFTAQDFERLGIDAGQRAERLSVAEYAAIARHLVQSEKPQ